MGLPGKENKIEPGVRCSGLQRTPGFYGSSSQRRVFKRAMARARAALEW